MASKSDGLPRFACLTQRHSAALGSQSVENPTDVRTQYEVAQQSFEGAPHTLTEFRSQADELLLRVQKQDKDALAELFDRYWRLVYSIGNRVLRSTDEAEDLVQEVFLFLWDRSNLFVPGRRPAHDWIIRVIYHRAFDRRRYLITRLAYKSSTQTCTAQSNYIDDQTARIVAKEGNFGELLYWESYLKSAFAELSEDQQKTLKMFFYEGYTLAEISATLGESLVNIRNYYYRGLRKLSRTFGNR